MKEKIAKPMQSVLQYTAHTQPPRDRSMGNEVSSPSGMVPVLSTHPLVHLERKKKEPSVAMHKTRRLSVNFDYVLERINIYI